MQKNWGHLLSDKKIGGTFYPIERDEGSSIVKRTINPSRPAQTKFLVTDEGKTLEPILILVTFSAMY